MLSFTGRFEKIPAKPGSLFTIRGELRVLIKLGFTYSYVCASEL